jgi:hypothetical protein
VGGEAPVTPVSSPYSSFLTFPTNRAITFWRRCRGTLSLHSSNDISLVSLAYLATPLAFPPISLVVSRKLSGDSTDDESNNDFTMGSRKL